MRAGRGCNKRLGVCSPRPTWPNHAVEPTPTASAPASLRLLARLTAGVRLPARLADWEEVMPYALAHGAVGFHPFFHSGR